MSSAADGEERKEKDNIEASKLIRHYNDNIPENIRNDPKNDTSIIRNQIEQPTIDKDATTESTTSSIPGSTNGEESKEKEHVEVPKIIDPRIEINAKEKRNDETIIPPQINDNHTTDTELNSGTGTDLLETNDMINEIDRGVDVPVELTLYRTDALKYAKTAYFNKICRNCIF